MKLSDKVRYMIIGAAIALSGFGLGSLVTGIDAENNIATFDSIYAKKIVATDFIGVGDPEGSRVAISNREHGGAVQIYNNNGDNCLNFFIDELGGNISVTPSDGKGGIFLSNMFGPGTLIATSSNGKGSISFTTDIPGLMVRGEHGKVNLSAFTVFGGNVTVTDMSGTEYKLMKEKKVE